jgi:hypothetical protein
LNTGRIGIDAPEQQMPEGIISAGSCSKLCRIANTISDSHIQRIVTIGML